VQELDIPRKDQFGDTLWKRTSASAIISTLKNPAYAGAFVYGRSQSLQSQIDSGKKVQKQLPIEQWKIIVKDKSPAYISWKTFEKIQAMLKDNYSEYDRNKSRGIPRDGAALLHGIVYCGECGHKMAVQYKQSVRYICNFLRQQYQVPVCQYIPANHVDEKVVEAFFEALSPIELDVYDKAIEEQKQKQEEISRAHHQQLQRLQYKVNLARRQYDQVDPDNRLVASELEIRWENALRDLKQAEKSSIRNEAITIPHLPTEIKESFTSIGKELPHIWNTPLISTSRKKALLRCLIDKVIIHRSYRDLLQSCIVWKGGATTTFDIPIPVGTFAELSCAEEMEKLILEMALKGVSDKDIAEQLSEKGFRSPMKSYLLSTTVQNIRLKHRLLRNSSQSHPKRIPGFLTVSQIAERLDVSRHWIYDRINKGCIQIVKDLNSDSYLFPDDPSTIELFKKLRKGQINELKF